MLPRVFLTALNTFALLRLAAVCLCTVSAACAAAPVRWSNDLPNRPAAWFATPEARAVAAAVLTYQSGHGAWPKNTDLSVPLTPEIAAEIKRGGKADTIDNGGTVTPLRFLARVHAAAPDPAYVRAMVRGLDYLLASQYPNGGFPQFFPLREGYYSRITFNDNATANVLGLLREIASGREPFGFVDADRRARCADAVARGIDCILRTQVRQDGKPTAWCAQHDEKTLAPAWARKYEGPSLSGNESVGLVRFLMGVENPSPEIVAAIEGAVAWLRSVRIDGLRIETFTGADGKRDRRAVPDPAAPPVWARFYELGTNRPLFMGRDSVPHYALAEIEQERRVGYAFYGDWPASLLEKDYPRWRAKLGAAR